MEPEPDKVDVQVAEFCQRVADVQVDLADEIAALKAKDAQRDGEIAQLQAENTQLRVKDAQQDAQIAQLKQEMTVAAGALHQQLEVMTKDYGRLIQQWEALMARVPRRRPPSRVN